MADRTKGSVPLAAVSIWCRFCDNNGDGARLKQTVAGTVTTYTQDLAAPLPVILQARTGSATTQYLCALGTRPLAAARNGGAWEYLLPDALGSVRQIADANGNVTLAESYEPYGSVLTSTGTASSIFGYAGEQLGSYVGVGLGVSVDWTVNTFALKDPRLAWDWMFHVHGPTIDSVWNDIVWDVNNNPCGECTIP